MHIEYALDQLSQGRSSKTIHNYYIRIRQIMKAALREKLIPTNPVDAVIPPRYEIKETCIMNTGEPQKAINTLNNDTNPDAHMWQTMFTLAFATGMRQAERFGLTPSELITIDGIHGIQITHQLQHLTTNMTIPNWLNATHITGNFYLLPPKTKQGKRFIPLNTQLWIDLNALANTNCTKPTDLIFTRDGQPLTSNVERRKWKQALQAAGLPYTTMRAARHFFSTHLAQTGASEDARLAIMSHAKITTTAGYTHWTPAALAQYANQAREAVTQ
ncbi:tyrosine-type recombinase/integrase [Alloscardovia venturai]|uniref:Tyrosine-type recombinase/integrase n=1 Tax=Alloscardovia venturai TaxID=1769421 RepID=A0ABW2Y672_9BIFI